MISEAIKELDFLLQQEADEKAAQKQKAYLRNLFPFLGIPKPKHRELLRLFFKKVQIQTENELIAILHELWQKEEREYQYSALDIAKKYHKLWTPNIFATFEMMIRQKSWWDTVDDIASNLTGLLLQKETSLIQNMDKWIEDPCLWIRRTALIYQLKWKKKTDEIRLFSYCEKTMEEKDFFMRKAIGWALREHSKTHPQSVDSFIKKNRQALSPLSFKEASRILINKNLV